MQKIVTTVIESSNFPDISVDTLATVYNTGNIVEVITASRQYNTLLPYRKLNKNQFVNTETGEIGFYNRSVGKASQSSLTKTFTKLRRIINQNFVGDETELFLTLTYATYMEDLLQVRKDFKQFIASLRYHLPVEYVACLEPQQSGSWHLHVLLKRVDGVSLTLSQGMVNRLWKHGIAFVEPLPFSDNFGAYFTARLIDIDELEGDGHSLQRQKKSIIKGQRLKFYPSGCHVFRCSRGIKRPVPQRLSYGEVMQIVEACTPCFKIKRNIVIKNEDGSERTVNTVFYEQFKKR